MEGIITRAMGEPDIPDLADRARIIGHVWYSALVGWVNGWSHHDPGLDELVVAVRLLLPDELVESERPAIGSSPATGRRDALRHGGVRGRVVR